MEITKLNHLKSEFKELAHNSWLLLSSYMGQLPKLSQEFYDMPGLKLFVFIIFFFGNIVFMSYRASLTSELSIRREKMPFNSVQGMYEANYNVVTHWEYFLYVLSQKDAKELFNKHSKRVSSSPACQTRK